MMNPLEKLCDHPAGNGWLANVTITVPFYFGATPEKAVEKTVQLLTELGLEVRHGDARG